MCSIILRIEPTGTLIAANRDEMVNRAWDPPATHWPEHPGIIAGRDATAGGTWMGLNSHGVMAAILNRHGTLGPATGKRSRGEIPLLALAHPSAAHAALAMSMLDAGAYRSFNLVIADPAGAYVLAGLEQGCPVLNELPTGTWMITSGEPNEFSLPRIARHQPKFAAAAFADWPSLLTDNTKPLESALNIPESQGFATVSAALMSLPANGAPSWQFCPGPPDTSDFYAVTLP